MAQTAKASIDSFYAKHDTVCYGNVDTVIWHTSHEVGVALDDGIGPFPVFPNGYRITTPLYSDITYTLNTGDSIATVTITVIHCPATSEPKIQKPEVKIYPNPFTEKLFIENSGTYNVSIMDYSKKIFFSKKAFGNIIIDRGNIPSGNYLLEITNNKNENILFKIFAK